MKERELEEGKILVNETPKEELLALNPVEERANERKDIRWNRFAYYLVIMICFILIILFKI